MSRPRLALSLLVLAACGEGELPTEGYVTVYVDTDAPVPGSGDATPLFDRLRIEIIPAGSSDPCASCARDFDARAEDFAHGVSMTVVAHTAPPTVRVRLYRSASLVGGRLSTWSTVDVWARIPVANESGDRDVTIFLPTDRAGQPLGSLEAPTDATDGAPAASKVGTWPGGARVPCNLQTRAHEICVPGGAFWFGSPFPTGVFGDLTAVERLVVLSPFVVDDREVTVAAYRKAMLLPPAQWSGSRAGQSTADYCTYTAAVGSNEDRPVNCLRWESAQAYCAASGGGLPTEAQLAYLISRLGTTPYVWGTDEPSCALAVYGEGGTGPVDGNDQTCLATLRAGDPTAIGWPLPAASGKPSARGQDLGGGVLWDVAGNLSEYARDGYAQLGEPCWAASTGALTDPLCKAQNTFVPGGKPTHTVRGGDWASAAEELRVTSRRAAAEGAGDARVGFRCARSQ